MALHGLTRVHQGGRIPSRKPTLRFGNRDSETGLPDSETPIRKPATAIRKPGSPIRKPRIWKPVARFGNHRTASGRPAGLRLLGRAWPSSSCPWACRVMARVWVMGVGWPQVLVFMGRVWFNDWSQNLGFTDRVWHMVSCIMFRVWVYG